MNVQRYRLGSSLLLQPGIVTLGNFDGVHLGHQAVIRAVIAAAKNSSLKSTVVFFEPQPREFFQAEVPARLTKMREKLLHLEALKVDQVVIVQFNQIFSQLSPEEFVETLLVNQLQAKQVIVGSDYRFGFQRAGDFDLLTTLGKQYGFLVQAYPAVLVDGERVSSSRIRMALAKADMDYAARLLDRWYSLSGRVVHGDKLGRELGFPTANIFLHRDKSPVQGIFVVQMRGVDAKPIQGVANIGSRPAVGGTRVILEVHLFDFNRDIYGHYVEVDLLHKLRDEEYYDSLDKLKFQIANDVDAAKRYFHLSKS